MVRDTTLLLGVRLYLHFELRIALIIKSRTDYETRMRSNVPKYTNMTDDTSRQITAYAHDNCTL
jgi:hypothetical protein